MTHYTPFPAYLGTQNDFQFGKVTSFQKVTDLIDHGTPQHCSACTAGQAGNLYEQMLHVW